jgi:hypothetical protein
LNDERIWKSLLLRPIDVVAKLRVKTFYIETQHAVHAQLAQLSRISGSEGLFFFRGEIVLCHDGFEIRQRSLNARLIHFQIKEQATQVIATHRHLQRGFEFSVQRL